MTEPPHLDHVTGLVLMPEAPAGVVCWTGALRNRPGTPVSVIVDGRTGGDLDPAFIDGVCADPGILLAAAATAAGLDPDLMARWDPELTFRPGRNWEVRFAEAPGPTELGLLVVFEGVTPTEVDDMSDWDF
ncbi:hypothetical protein [Actinoplanes couchii]|uniref:Uncharacterized protein n=1 Tax=Actinoplanes couchii TaxID=403638 RepID=A0ABQ3XQR3_9ACTN|nr:hypothetical protein [Actinoplanes couchii]MDR6317449.1 hypothetical protein [Actinoplanes couchii]GID60750.1 hypothetical protein Aco03nite_091540 [Actinoplanes couchii]